jgi:protein MPE1
MSSSVHFKFKSQKEPSRVTFDGTGISVFELKREIINQSRLGDGSDFELSIYNEDTGEGKLCGFVPITSLRAGAWRKTQEN